MPEPTGRIDQDWAAVGRLPLDDQLAALEEALSLNETLVEVLDRAVDLAAPDWYLTAGCLFQTAWNVVTGRPPTHGIRDYDLFYFAPDDLSWEAEDRVIQAGAALFADLPVSVEIRNEARVHLWYEEKFGVPCPPHTSVESAVGSFAATTCCLAVRQAPGGRWRFYAPHGLSDVFNLVLRPNPSLAPESVYRAKADRWRHLWPELSVLPWPAG